MTTVVDERKRAQAKWIAKDRGESDAIGVGLSAVVRREIDRYINRHYDTLPPELRD